MQRSVRFPPELAQKIEAVARAEDRSFSRVVIRLCEQALADPSVLRETLTSVVTDKKVRLPKSMPDVAEDLAYEERVFSTPGVSEGLADAVDELAALESSGWRCRVPTCSFRAPSEKARCPSHPGVLRPA
jgi:hypothetical protein